MPYMDEERHRLFFLFDRRKHGSKWGLGAYQCAQISTGDLKNWESHPLAISIDDQKEGSICTGSVIRNNGQYYAFYAVRTIDQTPAWLSCSVSNDGVHFSKTGKIFTLSGKYHAPSARDPRVFKDSSGLFHLLVTTSLGNNADGTGCLAHLESPDLEAWEEKEPFLVLDTREQPECSDYFFYKGFFYLVYSTSGLGRYLISREPFGPWEKPENNIVIGNFALVPKSCIWHSERLLFMSWSPEYFSFGGGILFHEAKQQADGSLKFFPLPEMA
jgi:sucrose-6-phosphate hydrolase SacC (GH32 family)